MNAFATTLSLSLLCGILSAQSDDGTISPTREELGLPPYSADEADTASPSLSIAQANQVVRFELSMRGDFMGAVLLSTSSDKKAPWDGLPEILVDHVVIGVAKAHDSFAIELKAGVFPEGLRIFAQGLVADGTNVQATSLLEMTRPASADRYEPPAADTHVPPAADQLQPGDVVK